MVVQSLDDGGLNLLHAVSCATLFVKCVFSPGVQCSGWGGRGGLPGVCWSDQRDQLNHTYLESLYSPAQVGQKVMSSDLYLQCNDCEECGAIPAHICNSGRKCRLSTILTRYQVYICGRKGKRKIWIKNERHTVTVIKMHSIFSQPCLPWKWPW